MISKKNVKRYPSLSQRPWFGKNAGGQQLTIKTWHSLNQDFFFHFNMQKYIQDLHTILHTLNHTVHSIFPCEHILRQHELSFSFLLFFHVFEMSLVENKCLNVG